MSKWALILGGSSGIGLATARKLGSNGFNLIVVHRDRRNELESIQSAFDEITNQGTMFRSFNFDATNEDKIDELLPQILSAMKGEKVSLLIHSISRGNLKPLISGDLNLTPQDLNLTIDAMATSLFTWVNKLVKNSVFDENSQIVTLTSAGSHQYWPGYAAVGLAKSALETLSKYLAVEMAPLKIRVNCIQAGITDTPSLKLIPGYEELKKLSAEKNPGKRMTKPEDVANAVYLLSLPEADWINGSLIHVDGGEHLL
ncbi:MAG: enoyl-ACP reductase [Bacteroidota bacterium]